MIGGYSANLDGLALKERHLRAKGASPGIYEQFLGNEV